jgi:hypothetical protein
MEVINCAKCKNRIGNHCKELDKRLNLEKFEKELVFEQPENCPGGERKND